MWKLMCLNTTCYYIRCFYSSFIHSLSARLYHTRAASPNRPRASVHTHNSIWVARHVAVDSAQIMFRTAVYFTCHFSSVSIYSTRLHATRQFTSIVPFFSESFPDPGFFGDSIFIWTVFFVLQNVLELNDFQWTEIIEIERKNPHLKFLSSTFWHSTSGITLKWAYKQKAKQLCILFRKTEWQKSQTGYDCVNLKTPNAADGIKHFFDQFSASSFHPDLFKNLLIAYAFFSCVFAQEPSLHDVNWL